ncbi:Methionine import ATP-binding protein MetN [[Clostridium] cellulosi]|jgi:ABC transporter.|uniref:Methionine import ATP-binding protein MetN n=1 Tax=[Clostridium] cellulosi TaxID=29343 RepID=A0A078KND3_9FIRM|nr:MAG: ABC transporter [[Clostridium] cellulosi]CDZ23968.1 Methionine import ATP-binding protein MetN [[Clostridium] cellulosi]
MPVDKRDDVTDRYIQISDLHKTFHSHGSSLQVLKGINLTVRKGEIFGIIGFSGAGKSTLARCINRLETPDSGSIKVGGVDILSLSKKELLRERKKIGMIFQTFNLFESKNVYRNIAYPLEISGIPKAEIRRRVLETAELVGLSDKLDAYPGGLSGGQKQRVGIARALVNRPELLLSDEATSALDPQTTLQILDLLKEINRATGITILMITHELDAIRYTCERMAVLEDGKITEVGSVREIFSNPHSRTGALFAQVFTEFQQTMEMENGSGI